MSDQAVKLPESVLAEARSAAREDGLSLGQMIASLVIEGLDHRKELALMRERAARADIRNAIDVLDRVPDVPPEKGNELRRA